LEGFDTDRNGQISLRELLDHVGDNKDVHAAFKGWHVGFKEADADKNGQLNLKELSALLSRVSRQDQHTLVQDSEASTALSIMDGMDTNRDGKLSLRELVAKVGDRKELHGAFKGWHDGFKQADLDKDGHLTVKELTALLAKVSRNNQHELVQSSEATTAAKILDGLDADKDGKMSLHELIDHMSDKPELHEAFKGWHGGFKAADADKDGHLDLEEVTSLISHLSRKGQQELVQESDASVSSQLLDGLDTDRNGKISLKELVDHAGDESNLHASFKGWKVGFQEADKDGDGELTEAELTSLLSHVSTENQHELIQGSEAETAALILDGFDTNKNGQVSLRELREHVGDSKELHAAFKGWQQGFKDADKDGNGQLNIKELTTLLSRVSRKDQQELVHDSTESTAYSVLDGFDENKDGHISMQELMRHVSYAKGAKDNKELPATLRKGFKDADMDGNGHLSVDELTNLLSRISRSSQRELVHDSEASQATQVLQGFDIDKDGKISMKELMYHVRGKNVDAAFKGWETGFKQADKDKDGHLSEDELSSLIALVSRPDQQYLMKESEKAAVSMMNGLDTDGNGKISLEEIEQRMGSKDRKNANIAFKGWLQGFKDADVDGDSQLDVGELTAFYEKLSAPRHDEM
jgi:Ca2+-binding EF-hand superfamily protein